MSKSARLLLLLPFLLFVLDRLLPSSLLRGTGLLPFHPESYHGRNTAKNFFEGWYYKQQTSSGDGVVAVVPGVFYGNSTDSQESHAFVFVNVGGTSQHYYRFPLSEFSTSKPGAAVFWIAVGGNNFTDGGIEVDLVPREGDDASVVVKG